MPFWYLPIKDYLTVVISGSRKETKASSLGLLLELKEGNPEKSSKRNRQLGDPRHSTSFYPSDDSSFMNTPATLDSCTCHHVYGSQRDACASPTLPPSNHPLCTMEKDLVKERGKILITSLFLILVQLRNKCNIHMFLIY